MLGIYPRTSVKEAWYGAAADTLRQYMVDGNLDGGCKLCHLAIESGNYSGTKARYYDGYAHSIDYTKKNGLLKWFGKQSFKVLPPKVFEFELSNVCNLECVMCDGYFSSSIRQNREHLPPLSNPYDDKFVDERAEFLPGITDLKFLGGEPFLIDAYLKIWERVESHKSGY
ncbi:MAG: hypothetical protein IPN29_02155 [Saprospiraceae bacterium]|nr:hypothetical protein [Saprospiraceae bacterium]